MKKEHIWQGIYLLIGIVECFLLSITTTILAAPYFYRLWLISPHLTQISGLSKETIYDNFYATWLFLVHPEQNEFYLPNLPSSSGAIQHFYEVKAWFMIVFIAAMIGFVFFIILYRKIKNQPLQIAMLNQGFNGGMLLPLALLLMAVVAFDHLFLWMHEVLFNNDLWLFDPYTDPIIELLPQSFFFGCLILIVLIYEIYLHSMKKLTL